MNDSFSYYDSDIKSEPVKITWPKDNEILELTRTPDGLVIPVQLEAGGKANNPVLYVWRGRGVLRLNRYTFFAVTIPDELAAGLRGSLTVDLSISFSNDTSANEQAEVKHLLCLPDFLVRELPPKEKKDNAGKNSMKSTLDRYHNRLDEDDEEDEEEKKDEKDEDDEKEDDMEEDAENEDVMFWPRTSPRRMFRGWIERSEGEIVFESAVHGYILAHDNYNLMLASFFDKRDPSWLADEDSLNNEPPLWFSEYNHEESPLYRLGLVVRHISRLPYCNVLPMTILSDHLEIVNSNDMQKVWRKLGINVCYCIRAEKNVTSFVNLLVDAGKNGGKYLVPGKEELNMLKNELIKFEKDHQ